VTPRDNRKSVVSEKQKKQSWNAPVASYPLLEPLKTGNSSAAANREACSASLLDALVRRIA
jgi:hypothetical protein